MGLLSDIFRISDFFLKIRGWEYNRAWDYNTRLTTVHKKKKKISLMIKQDGHLENLLVYQNSPSPAYVIMPIQIHGQSEFDCRGRSRYGLIMQIKPVLGLYQQILPPPFPNFDTQPPLFANPGSGPRTE